MNLFEFSMEQFKFGKTINIVECFAGIGTQAVEQVHGEDWNKGQDGKDFYYLKPKYETVNSYNNKAVVVISPNGETIPLLSYGEPVVRINTDTDKVTLLDKWNESATTLRHVKEFLRQEGFVADNKNQIAKDYEQSSVGDASKPNISYELTDTNGESDYDTFYELRKAIAHAEKDKSVVLIDKIEWGNGTTDKTKKTTVWTREKGEKL